DHDQALIRNPDERIGSAAGDLVEIRLEHLDFLDGLPGRRPAAAPATALRECRDGCDRDHCCKSHTEKSFAEHKVLPRSCRSPILTLTLRSVAYNFRHDMP